VTGKFKATRNRKVEEEVVVNQYGERELFVAMFVENEIGIVIGRHGFFGGLGE